jgi:hypothetical protein
MRIQAQRIDELDILHDTQEQERKKATGRTWVICTSDHATSNESELKAYKSPALVIDILYD